MQSSEVLETQSQRPQTSFQDLQSKKLEQDDYSEPLSEHPAPPPLVLEAAEHRKHIVLKLFHAAYSRSSTFRPLVPPGTCQCRLS